MKVIMNTLSYLVLFLCTYKEATGVILSPCKVRNMVTQPQYATSLRTKGLVNIVQMPPVFIQNVMVGICENQNQNYTTGRPGEFYSCQQRYSIVEVFIAETSPQAPSQGGGPGPTQQSQNQSPNPSGYNDIQYVRESVIIESGCDFIFNLLPLIANSRRLSENNPPPPPPQQHPHLRSPYHPNVVPGLRQTPPPPSPPSGPSPVMNPQVPMSPPEPNMNSGYPGVPPQPQPPHLGPGQTQGRSGSSSGEEVENTENDATQDSILDEQDER